MRLSDNQWWVIWLALGLVLLIWWNDMGNAGLTAARNSPDYVRSEQQLVRDYENGQMTGPQYMENLKFWMDRAYDEAYRQERTKRLVGTVVLLASFVVWLVGRRGVT